MAAHCDLLVDRLNAQEAVTADVGSTFGQEIAQLRAEVASLQRSLADPAGRRIVNPPVAAVVGCHWLDRPQ